MSVKLGRFAIVLALAAGVLPAPPAHALRVATWNLLAYDDAAVPARRPYMIQVVPGLNPDVMIVQELLTSTAADSFANLLKATMPSRVWKGGSSTFILGTQSALYYDSLAVSISNLTAVTTGGPRQVLVALVRPVGFLANAASFRLYSVHFKAGDGSTPSDSAQRTLECTNLRNMLNLAPAGTNLVVGGDTNFYGSYEVGYTRLTESQADNDGRMKDPQTISGTWNNPAFAALHSQSPCAGSGCIGSSGGMDDRFDILFSSYSLNDGLGLDMVGGSLPGGYGPYGNDGLHYNDSIDGGGFNNVVPLAVATSLRLSSDHVPVIATLQLPAKLGAVASAVDFGDAIVGGTALWGIGVNNVATPPAAALSYSLTAPAGFGAQGGTFNKPAGQVPDLQTISMSTATVGVKSGTLTVNSNDLDTTAKAVLLSGRVLSHAVPSFDSTTATTVTSLDFGTVDEGTVTEKSLRLFNLGYSPLQARLVRTSEFMVQIPAVSLQGSRAASGGPGFSFQGPPATPITDAGTYAISFDATGAVPGLAYVAQLRIAPADEPLPGALAYDTLRVDLSTTIRGNGGVGGLPAVLRFAPPAPNPLHRSATFAFDLPEAASVSLAIFDAGGRRVAQLADGPWPAGRHRLDWSAVRDGKTLPAGLYFASFRTRGLEKVARLVVLP
jgi:endonuclease/exonuclease/phosphatase family metal-dependent hydrolase